MKAMGLAIHTESPPLSTDETGTVRVAGTRVTLDSVIGSFNGGSSPEQIAQQFPSVSLADVYAAIGYYLRHPDQVNAYLQERSRQADDLRRQIESDPQTQRIRESLQARKSAQR